MPRKNLLVAATAAELSNVVGNVEPYVVTKWNDNWDVLITGVGMVATVFHLTKALQLNMYRQVVNVGLAGAINRNLEMGQIVNVIADQFGFFGAEAKGQFLSVFDLQLQKENEAPFQNKMLIPNQTDLNFTELQNVSGITMQSVTGHQSTLSLLQETYSADVESMEGAAIFYVAIQFAIPAAQLRAISNYVEPRDRENWKINEALESLKEVISSFLEER